MHIREYTNADLASLRALHAAQGMPYAFPDLTNPLFLTRLVLVRDGNAVRDTNHDCDGNNHCCRAEANNAADNCPAKHSHVADSGFVGAAPHNSEIIAAVFLRLTAEAYFLLDPTAGTPRDRWRALLLLHEAARGEANRRGLDDAHAWLPPQVARAFGRRIAHLGWSREPWPCYSRSIAAPTPFS
jgi:hypothetical protein